MTSSSELLGFIEYCVVFLDLMLANKAKRLTAGCGLTLRIPDGPVIYECDQYLIIVDCQCSSPMSMRQ